MVYFYIYKLGPQFKNLEILIFGKFTNLIEKDLHEIQVYHFSNLLNLNLELLQFLNDNFVDKFMKMERLKSLTLPYNSKISEKAIRSLIQR